MIQIDRAWIRSAFGLGLLTAILAIPTAGQAGAPPEFVRGSQGEFVFDTGVVRGVLRPNGSSRGLSSVVHAPTGVRLDGGSGLLGYYRVFTTNHRYGTAGWNWPSTARLLPDGAVAVTWPAEEGRPFRMHSIYRWQDCRTLDLVTTVTAEQPLSQFEVFLSSYCDKALTTPSVYIHPASGDGPCFRPSEKAAGDWQVFLRKPAFATLLRDGRWQQPPHPVDWIIQPPLARPLCLRRGSDPAPTVILMAPPEDCFAVFTPYRGESHYSLYLSLFGRDIAAGQSATARVRLVVAGAVSDADILALYEAYEREK
jgi:hypothetical protein